MRATAYELTRCIVCGSGRATELADREAMRAELEALWVYHGRRLRAGVPVARLADRVVFSELPPVRLVRCDRCGFVYRNPIERDREVRSLYARHAPAGDTLRSLHETQRRAYRSQARRLRRVLGRAGSGLEVGSYVGAFLAAARDEGFRFDGVDVNASVNGFARSLGFTVHDGELADVRSERAYDAVAIWNCFDQLPEPRAAVRASWRLLRPGGILAIRVANGAFYARLRGWLDRGGAAGAVACALLAQNNLLGFPYRYGFTAGSLRRLLGESGFEPRCIEGDALVRTADEWTRGWARLEEWMLRRTLALATRTRPRWAPWIESYAVKRGGA